MMKTLLAASAALLLPVVASAADMPTKYRPAPAPAVAPVGWTGWYAGVQGGWIRNNNGAKETSAFWTDGPEDGGGRGTSDWYSRGDNILDATAGNQDFDATGAMFGGTIGYNVQFNSFVLGLEGDLSWTNLEGSASQQNEYSRAFESNSRSYGQTTSVSSKMDWFATLRARGGFLLTPGTLVFASGGLAAGGVKASLDVNGTYDTNSGPGTDTLDWASNASVSKVKYGWAVGGGIEHKMNAEWTVKAEYLHYDLGSVDVTNSMGAAIANGNNHYAEKTNNYEFKGDIVRVGINRQF